MVTITSDMAGTTLIVMGVGYVLTFAYSIYMGILNHRQSKVKDILIETNKILIQIRDKQGGEDESKDNN